MLDVIQWRKDENFHKQDFRAFMRGLAKQAKKSQKEKLCKSSITASEGGDKFLEIRALRLEQVTGNRKEAKKDRHESIRNFIESGTTQMNHRKKRNVLKRNDRNI